MSVKTKPKEIKNLTPDQFYQSIDILHRKVKKLNQIILNYFQDKTVIYTKDFFAVQFINNKVHDVTESLEKSVSNFEELKVILELWFENKEESEFIDDIFKIEVDNKIFLFQYFRFENTNDGVIAGYVINNTINSRILLFNISNSRILKSSQTIMEYFNR